MSAARFRQPFKHPLTLTLPSHRSQPLIGLDPCKRRICIHPENHRLSLTRHLFHQATNFTGMLFDGRTLCQMHAPYPGTNSIRSPTKFTPQSSEITLFLEQSPFIRPEANALPPPGGCILVGVHRPATFTMKTPTRLFTRKFL